MTILDTLAPIFLLIALGAALRKAGFLSAAFLKDLNRLTYWVGLPALLFESLATAAHGVSPVSAVLWVLLAGTVGALALGYLGARLLRVPSAATGTFVQAGFRGNLAYIGLPILFALPDAPGPGGGSVRTLAILALAPLLVVYNAVAVIALLSSQHGVSWAMAPRVMRAVVKNPLILASVAGGLVAWLGGTLPVVLARTLTPLGELALPCALLCIGGSLLTTPLHGNRRVITAAALLKTVLCPLLGYAAACWLGLDGEARRLTLVFLACPTAAASYTMALELGGDEALASGSIVLSTLFSAAALAAVLALA